MIIQSNFPRKIALAASLVSMLGFAGGALAQTSGAEPDAAMTPHHKTTHHHAKKKHHTKGHMSSGKKSDEMGAPSSSGGAPVDTGGEPAK